MAAGELRDGADGGAAEALQHLGTVLGSLPSLPPSELLHMMALFKLIIAALALGAQGFAPKSFPRTGSRVFQSYEEYMASRGMAAADAASPDVPMTCRPTHGRSAAPQ